MKQLRELEAKIEPLLAERKALPKRVSAVEAGGLAVTRREAKAVVDRVKLATYNAEEWLLDRLVFHYPNPHDVRDLLRSFAELSGTIDTTPTAVLVSLDPPDTPIHRQALRGLVEDLNNLPVRPTSDRRSAREQNCSTLATLTRAPQWAVLPGGPGTTSQELAPNLPQASRSDTPRSPRADLPGDRPPGHLRRRLAPFRGPPVRSHVQTSDKLGAGDRAGRW